MSESLLSGVNLYLVGMMGSGKTTVGEILARELRYGFCDCDRTIEKASQQTISQLFETEGEARFRELETQVLAQISTYRDLVVATGGGIVLDPMNWSYLHHGIVVWLDASVEVLCDRLQADTTRPLLQNGDLQEKLSDILAARRSRYAQADVRAQIEPQDDPQAVAQQVLALVKTVLKPKATPGNGSANPLN